MARLPLLLSIPHGGTRVPPELTGHIALSAADVYDDIDLFTPELYDLRALALHTVIAGIARPFVDLNRAPDQLPPAFPDGIIKSHTCFNVPVYLEGHAPDDALTRHLIATYHAPYHAELERLLHEPGVALMLDCHSMSEYPPPVAPDRETRRPLVNLGDADGESCPRALTAALARAFRDALRIGESDVTINTPFRGGYITRRHGSHSRPVIQVEINRALYFDPEDRHRRNDERIARVRTAIETALRDFCTGSLA
jgi:formiminoglutamase